MSQENNQLKKKRDKHVYREQIKTQALLSFSTDTLKNDMHYTQNISVKSNLKQNKRIFHILLRHDDRKNFGIMIDQLSEDVHQAVFIEREIEWRTLS